MRHRPLWALIVALLVVQVLILPLLTIDAPWFDEVITYQRIGGPPFDLSRNIVDVLSRTIQIWAPLYFVLASIWGNLVGNSLFALRYGSVLLGMLAVAWVYRLGTDVFSRRIGLIAAILLATSSFFLHYWHDARPYTLYVLLAIIVLWTYWQVMYNHRRRFIWWLHLSLLALFYTHFVSILLVSSLFIYHGVQHWRQPTGSSRQLVRHWRRLVILFVPGVVFAAQAALKESSNPRGLTFFEIWPALFQDFGNGLGWLLLALVAYAVFIGYRRQPARYLLTLGGMYLLLAIGVNFVADYLFHMRHILVLLPILLLLVSLAIDDLWQRMKPLAVVLVLAWGGVGVGATAGWWTLGTAHIPLFLSAQPFEQAQDFIRVCVQADDVVVFHMTDTYDEADVYPTLVYYVAQKPVRFEQFRTFTSAQASVSPSEFEQPDTPYDQLVQEFVAGAPRVWLLMPPERADDPIVGQSGEALAAVDYTGPQPSRSSELIALLYAQPAATGCLER